MHTYFHLCKDKSVCVANVRHLLTLHNEFWLKNNDWRTLFIKKMCANLSLNT